MIRHIVMFKLKDPAAVPAVFERAEALRAIPEIRRFQLVRNAPRTPEKNYDLALIFDFDSIEALDAYHVCETHVAFGQFITPLRDLRTSLDYEV